MIRLEIFCALCVLTVIGPVGAVMPSVTAVWGHGAQTNDATVYVRLVLEHGTELSIRDELLGDPAPRLQKTLTATCMFDGQTCIVAKVSGETLTFEDFPAPVRAAARAARDCLPPAGSGWSTRPPRVLETLNATNGMLHPGIGLNASRIDTIVRNVRGGVEPWKSLFARATADGRFSKAPRFLFGGEEHANNQHVDDRLCWDGETATCQMVMYLVTGQELYRSNALSLVRRYYMTVKDGSGHWDCHFRWGNAIRTYLMAAELLRYSEAPSVATRWTSADTDGVAAFCRIGLEWSDHEYYWMNQHGYAIGGVMAYRIFTDDAKGYAENVERMTVNRHMYPGFGNGSIQYLCRLVTQDDSTGKTLAVPNFQYAECGRDIGHPFPGLGITCEVIEIVRSQLTRVHPVSGEIWRGTDAVDPLEFRDHSLLRGANYICRYNLGMDTRWVPQYANPSQVYTCLWNAGGGRGRIVPVLSILYNHYRYENRSFDLNGEDARYFAYAYTLQDIELPQGLFYMPSEAAGRWRDVQFRSDPARRNFADYILPADSRMSVVAGSDGHRYLSVRANAFILPLFTKGGHFFGGSGPKTIRYRSNGDEAVGVVNPEDYGTEKEASGRYIHVAKFLLPDTHGEWRDYKFDLTTEPDRELIKLRFGGHATQLDLECISDCISNRTGGSKR